MKFSPLKIKLILIGLVISVVTNVYFLIPENTKQDWKYWLTHSERQYELREKYAQPLPDSWEEIENDYPECAFHIHQKMAMEAITGTKKLNINDLE